MIDLRQFICPQCNKPRLYRQQDHKVSDKKVKKELASGETIEHFVDICQFCAIKLYNRYYVPTKADAKKVLHALKEGQSLGDKSLEELL